MDSNPRVLKSTWPQSAMLLYHVYHTESTTILFKLDKTKASTSNQLKMLNAALQKCPKRSTIWDIGKPNMIWAFFMK